MNRTQSKDRQLAATPSSDVQHVSIVVATRLSMAVLLAVAAVQLAASFQLQTQIADIAWVGTVSRVVVGLLVAGFGWLTCESIKNARKH